MLTKKEIEELKSLLLKNKEKLEKELSTIATKNEDGEWEPEYVDLARDEEVNANEVEDFTNKASVVNALTEDLKNTNLALNKIANNTYGQCEICGQNIPLERLRAIPEARTCANCKL